MRNDPEEYSFVLFFFIFSNSGHPLKQLSNVIEILIHITRPFEMEYQVEKNEPVQHFFFSFFFKPRPQSCQRCSIYL